VLQKTLLATVSLTLRCAGEALPGDEERLRRKNAWLRLEIQRAGRLLEQQQVRIFLS
jgi:hypothetical protein